MRKIKVVMCPADRPPYITSISDSLANMQRIVGGYIETVAVGDNIFIVCDEEGRLLHKQDNKSLAGFVGDCFIARSDGEDFCDLGEEEATRLLKTAKSKWGNPASFATVEIPF